MISGIYEMIQSKQGTSSAINSYESFKLGSLTVVSQPGLRKALMQIYSQQTWVYDYLMARDECIVLRGRRPVVVGPVHSKSMVVKRLFHGGLMAGITRDCFLSTGRFTRPIDLAFHLRDHGIATPIVTFTAWRRIHGFIRGEIGVEYLSDGRDASDHLFGGTVLPENWEQCVRNIAQIMAKLPSIGVYHPDLNLMNFFCNNTNDTWLLDLDKGRIRTQVSHRMKRLMMDRLIRSIRKQGSAVWDETINQVIDVLTGKYDKQNAQN
jgi:tRNA A-37 threonylcarbamoyl transferase component Bud32